MFCRTHATGKCFNDRIIHISRDNEYNNTNNGVTQEVVQGDTRNPICKEIGEVLDELIEDGVL